MALALLPDGTMGISRTFIPIPHHDKGGRPRVPDRACLTALSLSFAAAFLGRCSRKNWGAVLG